MDEIERAHRADAHAADLAGRHRRRLPRRARPAPTAATAASPAPPAAPPIAPEETLTRRRPRPSARATPGQQARRGGRAARRDRRRPRPGALFLAGRHHAGAVRLRGAPTSASARCSTPWSSSRPAAVGRAGRRRRARARSTTPFSAFVFKVQAGMDTAHRDRLAFVRICSGVFERGMVVTHATHRPAVRHQVRPARVRPRAGDHRRRLPRRRRRAGQRQRPAASATRSTPSEPVSTRR